MALAGGPPARLSSDVVYRVLGNRRRRFVVHYLLQQEDSVPFRDLTEQVTAWENDIDLEAVTHDQRKRVYTALRQTHLPTLADAGLIDYDRQRGTVEPTDAIREFDIHLDIVASNDIPWSEFYCGLGALAVTTSGLILLGFPAFGLVDEGVWAILVASAVLVTGAVHRHLDRTRRLGCPGPPPELEYQR